MILQQLDNVINAISGFLYQPFIVPLFLMAAGLFFTVKTNFLQVTMFKEMFRVITEKPKEENGISSFGALMVSTASRVGTGNIVGVSTAICIGGPGAIFWMWLSAFLGGASAFVESTLAQIYKRRDEDGTSYGGPSYYIETALKQRWLGVLFAVSVLLTYAVGYNLLASYNMQSTLAAFSFYDASVTPMVVGIVLAVLFGLCVFGGAKRLVNVTGVLVPIMGVLYIIVSIVVLVINAANIGPMFSAIFKDAFTFKAGLGGFSGSCIMWGIKRGLYSNEAGMGSAPNAAATADVSHPAKQGLVQMLSVFMDTLLICSATAFMCLSTNVVPSSEISGAPYVQQSLQSVFGIAGPIFIAVAMALFAFTTLIGNYYYTEGCLRFIMKHKPSKGFLTGFRAFATFIVFAGAVVSAGLAWDAADLCQALMVVINVPCIVLLTGPAIACFNDYKKQRAEGKDPHFVAAENGIKEETDYWKA